MEEDQIANNANDKPDLIKETETMFFTLQHNLTIDAKNSIWGFLTLIKTKYPGSKHKEQWNILLKNLQFLMSDFENKSSESSEVQLTGLNRNAEDLKDEDERISFDPGDNS